MEMMELDRALAPTPEAAQQTVDQANMDAVKRLQAMMGGLGRVRPPHQGGRG